MRAIDRLILRLTRRSRKRSRERVLQEALPGLEGYYPPDSLPEAHTAAGDGLTAASRGLPATRRRLRMAVVVVVVAAGVGVPAYIAGGSIAAAGATEAAQEEAYEAASDEWDAAVAWENAALGAAVAAYSAEREAQGAPLPEDIAAERVREERPEWSAAKVAKEVESNGNPFVPSHTERDVAIEMWSAEPPASEVAQDAVADYEAAEEAADAAWTDLAIAQDDLR